jgi:arylsulfatase A-like enzyme
LGVGKWSVYDHDIRVPMLVSGPGIRPNSVLGGFVGSHADLAPTWLAMAGLPPASEMDGHSLLRSLINNPDDVTLPRSVQRRLQLDWQSLVPAAPKVAYVYFVNIR